MKNTTTILHLLSFIDFANEENFQIQLSSEDRAPENQTRMSHQLYRAKLFNCHEGNYGIPYKSIRAEAMDHSLMGG